MIFRTKIMTGMGAIMIVEDAKQPCEAIFVLSGNPVDRGREAGDLFLEGLAPKVVCLGGEHNPALRMYGNDAMTSELTKLVLLKKGVPENSIDLLPEGTSTVEEFEAITTYCKKRNINKIMVVSSLFHTRRIDTFFRLRLYFEGIEMVLRGASETKFEEEFWWKNEEGLLFLYNEYVKMGYYWLKY